MPPQTIDDPDPFPADELYTLEQTAICNKLENIYLQLQAQADNDCPNFS